MNRIIICLILVLEILNAKAVQKNTFIHPGIHQTKEDLELMKEKVLQEEQPWKNAYDSLVANTDLQLKVIPHTHVMRGPYGKPNIGGNELSEGAETAYRCALLWYITEDRRYAQKAIEILDAWSEILWDFDYNDAKLLAAWTGHKLCNAAEILRYTYSGSTEEGQSRFKHLLMTVYYPLIRFYFPKANGNWDGAIIHSILAIAVYTDNQEMFENGINHFLYGPVNGSIFKYILPTGQCQETARDQAHVQLGLGEFAGAARVAWSQGVDLFSIANNRIALGYEYTARFLLGHNPVYYVRLSERAKNLRDDYEYVYRHYTGMGVDVPFTKIAADSIRSKAMVSVLTAHRADYKTSNNKFSNAVNPMISYITGARAVKKVVDYDLFTIVTPGESVQEAIYKAAGEGGKVLLKSGIHVIPQTLQLYSNVSIEGEGIQTVVFLDSKGGRDAIVNAEPKMHNVSIRNLLIECFMDTVIPSDPNSNRSFKSRYNRGGIKFSGYREGDIKNVLIENVSIRNATYNGLFISGAENISIVNCDFSENGSDVVPGPKLQHNLLVTHSSNIEVKNSRLVMSPFGSGISLFECSNVRVTECELARNEYYGLLIAETDSVHISGCLIEGNSRSGAMIEYLSKGTQNISFRKNVIHYNNGFGIESFAVKNVILDKNIVVGNRENEQINISAEENILMDCL